MIPASKYDVEQSCVTKGFPARPSLQGRGEDAGHWLDAFRKTTERTHRQARIKETCRKQEKDGWTLSPCGRTLDAALLLRLRCTDQPTHLSSVDISERNLHSVNPEELRLFENLLYVDASANSLSLDSFSRLVSLRELSLTLNGLCNMTFDPDDFPHLQVLDLSYNSLSAGSISAIGGLPHLKVLHLTGNQLQGLPPDLGFPHSRAPTQPVDQENTSFRALEVLLLDDNRLSSQVFHSLKNLKRLKHLNLQGNNISKIPDFPLMDRLTVDEEQGEDDGLGYASTESNIVDARTILQQHWQETRRRSWLPLPNLRYLCLADNKIAEEEALLAATLFPRIRELDICSNPLTLHRSGDPPLLTLHLQEVLGVTIKRKETQPAVRVSAPSRSKEVGAKGQTLRVAEKVAPSRLPGPLRAEESDLTLKPTLTEETVREKEELFFLTQATTDAPENEPILQTAAKTKETLLDENIPLRPGHHEALMEVGSRSGNVGIQTAVWRLERALRNPKVPTDSRPSCRQQQWKVKERTAPTALKQVHEIMEELRQGSTTTTTTTRDVLLSSVLQGSSVGRQEAQQLLRDLRAKFKTLQQNMMGPGAGS